MVNIWNSGTAEERRTCWLSPVSILHSHGIIFSGRSPERSLEEPLLVQRSVRLCWNLKSDCFIIKVSMEVRQCTKRSWRPQWTTSFGSVAPINSEEKALISNYPLNDGSRRTLYFQESNASNLPCFLLLLNFIQNATSDQGQNSPNSRILPEMGNWMCHNLMASCFFFQLRFLGGCWQRARNVTLEIP